MRRRLILALGLAAMLAGGPVLAQGAGDGKNRRITVENLSRQSVKNLYASPVTADTWEEDMLGSEVMPPNTRRAANIDNGTTECMYDLKVVMMDGKEHVRRRVNVCAVSRWTIGDAGDSIS